MTHDQQEGVVRFINENDEVAYKMPYKIEQYNSLSNLEKEHTKSVYLRNEEDKRITFNISRSLSEQSLTFFGVQMMLIRELEALGERGVAVDSLESLKQTHARETAKLTALTDAIAESLAGIHKIDCFGSSSIPKLFNTAYKTPIGYTPYKLVYGKLCHLPIELEHRAYWALKHANFDLKTAGDHHGSSEAWGAAKHLARRSFAEGGDSKISGDGGVAADSSVSNGSVSSEEGTWSTDGKKKRLEFDSEEDSEEDIKDDSEEDSEEDMEGIVLGHKISKSGIEVDKAKVDVIAKLPHPTTVKGIRSFLASSSFCKESNLIASARLASSCRVCSFDFFGVSSLIIGLPARLKGMDKSKIARKQSKTSKHGHENQKSSKRSQRSKPKPEKPSLSQN
ncbi:hypothetical protein Tco_1350478 [Tanacetum coccineum]